MKLSEMQSGDIVAIELDGETALVMVGRVLGRAGTKRRAFAPTGVILDRVDSETFAYVPWSMRLVSPDIDVLEVVETADRRRRMRTRKIADDGDEVDPMRTHHDRANRSALADWAEERRGEDEIDGPF